MYRPLCLPPVMNDDPDKYEGRAVIATGWGSQNDLKTLPAANLKELDLTVFDLRYLLSIIALYAVFFYLQLLVSAMVMEHCLYF